MAILSKGCQPDNFESHNSLQPGFTNICRLHSNFAKCEFLPGSNFSDILALYGTNLDHSVDSGNFSVSNYLPLIPIYPDSITHMNGPDVYVKEGLPFAWD